jgi:cell division protein FtsQ
MLTNKIHTNKKLKSILWMLGAVACIVLLVSAVYYKDHKKCNGVKIEIVGDNLNYFINKYNVYAIVKKYGGDTSSNQPLATINLKKIEADLEKIVWVNKAELFFDNNNVLHVSVSECSPIARVFNSNGLSYYLDSAKRVLPLNNKYSARVPVFTGFASNGKMDSVLYDEIKIVGIKILSDSFLMAMIEQIDILPNKHFELIPKIGDQTILLGDASDIDSKFEKLKLFYKKVTPVVGWNKYSKLNLQFKNQIVASLKGVDELATDSITALQLIKSNAEFASKKSADSVQTFKPDNNKDDDVKIDTSAEREDEGEDGDVKTLNLKAVKSQLVTINAAAKVDAKPTIKTTNITTNSIKNNITNPVKKLETITSANKKPVLKSDIKPNTSPVLKANTKPTEKPITKTNPKLILKPTVKPVVKTNPKQSQTK